MKNSNFLPTVPSPTNSDGSKRLFIGGGMEQEFDSHEKFQKIRKVDSPTASNNGGHFQVSSPQYVELSNRSSPKPEKRSVSPKGIFPPPIQKYLNGKGPVSIDQTVGKLKNPTQKAFQEQLDKMRLLGSYQQQEVHTNIIFRKAHSNSPTSPNYSGSPIGSPMVVSPKNGPVKESENIVMTFEDDAQTQTMHSPPPQSVYSDVSTDKNNKPSQNTHNVANWMTHMMTQGNMTNGMIPQQNPGNMNFQNQGMQGMGELGTLNPMEQQELNIQWLQANNASPNMREGVRERTTSFMRDDEDFSNFRLGQMQAQPAGIGMNAGMGYKFLADNQLSAIQSIMQAKRAISPVEPNRGMNAGMGYKFLADNQLSAIQSIMQAKRAISPVEPNRGMMQYFQKRNSNPENHMRGPAQQQGLFASQNGMMDQNVIRKHSAGETTSPQQFIPLANLPQVTNTFSFQNTHQFMGFQNNFPMMNTQQQQQQQVNSQELQETGTEEQGIIGQNQQQLQGSTEGGFLSTQTNWDSSNSTGLLDVEEFFKKTDSEDFDMNIIPHDVDFIPARQCIDGLDSEFDEQFLMPEVNDRPAFGNGPNDLFRHNT